MFERGPFAACPECGAPDGLGLLSAGGEWMTQRCRRCRATESTPLPWVDKKVIYLDQFVFSELFKLQAGRRKASAPHADFYAELLPALRRAVLLQQLILPHSDIHHRETIVSPFGNELREAYEFLGGDVSLTDPDEVELRQTVAFAKAFKEQREPELDLSVDSILEGERNAWLPDMHISANVDFGMFADGIRQSRTSNGMQTLADFWAANPQKFKVLLARELDGHAGARANALANMWKRCQEAWAEGDLWAFGSAQHHPANIEFEWLSELFAVPGDPAQTARTVMDFWNWPKLREKPVRRISAHLYAALGRKVSNGQRKVTPSFPNDVLSIATYAPYVDAMFIDRECAGLLRDEPLRSRLTYRAKVFSYSNAQDFLDYVKGLAEAASPAVRRAAKRIYGAD